MITAWILDVTTCSSGKTYVECDICGKRSLYTELRPPLEREGSFMCECGNDLSAEAFQVISRVIVRTREEVLTQRRNRGQSEILAKERKITISLKDYAILRKAYHHLKFYVENQSSNPEDIP